MEFIKFKKEMFEDRESWPKGWHLMNNASGQQGEFTLCGIAFDGDATNNRVYAEFKRNGKVTCPNCISVIKLCKSVKL